jgi:2-polyprenyl-3-methyl-5-hydroxy-6-metoxy-1,4-benzoquinol methylase
MIKKKLELEETNCVLCNSNEFNTVATGQDYLHQVTEQTFTYVCCKLCGHLYLNPRPKINEISVLYPPEYSTFTKKFAQSNNALAWIKKKILLRRFNIISEVLPQNPKILDIGCGDLSFLISLRKLFPQASLEGLDWNFTDEIKNEAISNSIRLHVGTIEELGLDETKFDLIIMNQLIEHLWDVDKSLNSCYKALNNNGFISIETPNPDGWDRKFFKKGSWGGYYWPRHLNLFSSKKLTQIVEKSGFEVQKKYRLLAPPCWIYSLQFSLKRLVPSKNLKLYVPDDSLFFLGMFTVIDSIAKLLNLPTSNQKILAKKILKK